MVQEDIPIVPITPSFELLYTSKIEIDTPLSLGNAPYGERRIINITGGLFTAPDYLVAYYLEVPTGKLSAVTELLKLKLGIP